MATDAPIRAALKAAHREASSFYTEADTARIVIAFLRALPSGMTVGQQPGWQYEGWIGRDLAAALARAAEGEG